MRLCVGSNIGSNKAFIPGSPMPYESLTWGAFFHIFLRQLMMKETIGIVVSEDLSRIR